MIRVRVILLALMVVPAGWLPGGTAWAETAFNSGNSATLSFMHTPWAAEVLGQRASGLLGWIEGPDRSLRLELGHGEDQTDPGTLLSQGGKGWTVILGPDGEGTFNAWGHEWKRVDPGLGQLVSGAVDFLSEGAQGPNSRRIEIPDLTPEGNPADSRKSFRRDMVRRGRGRGGAGEIVVLTRLEDENAASWVYEIRSTRRPGSIKLGALVPLGLVCPVPEVFVPLWPLSDLTVPTGENPGTSSPDEG